MTSSKTKKISKTEILIVKPLTLTSVRGYYFALKGKSAKGTEENAYFVSLCLCVFVFR